MEEIEKYILRAITDTARKCHVMEDKVIEITIKIIKNYGNKN